MIPVGPIQVEYHPKRRCNTMNTPMYVLELRHPVCSPGQLVPVTTQPCPGAMERWMEQRRLPGMLHCTHVNQATERIL